jgi:hypothetical protein
MAVRPAKGVPWIHPGSVVQPKACRVILVPVMQRQQDMVVLTASGDLPFIGAALQMSRDSAVTMAERWMRKVAPTPGHHLVCFIAGKFDVRGTDTLVVACPISDEGVVAGSDIDMSSSSWQPLSHFKSSAEEVVTTVCSALVAVQQMMGWGVLRIPAVAMEAAMGLQGKQGPHRVYSAPLLDARTPKQQEWEALRERRVQEQLNALRLKLAATPASNEHHEWLRGWAELVTPMDVSHIPDHLLRKVDLKSGDITKLKCYHRQPPPATLPVVPPAFPPPPADYHPKSIADLTDPEVVAAHEAARKSWEMQAVRSLNASLRG